MCEMYNYLIEKEFFTRDELNLVLSILGNNMDTYEKMIKARYNKTFSELIIYDVFERN